MYLLIIQTIVLCQIFIRFSPIKALNNDIAESCPYQNTVNLTNHQRFENGSYLYEDILIPIEKQKLYNYYMKYSKIKKSVRPHPRGCVCERKACINMCCERNEYLSINKNIVKCVKLNPLDVKMSLMVKLTDKNNFKKELQVYKYFTTQVGLPCRQPKALNLTQDKGIWYQDRLLHIQMNNLTYSTMDYCYSPLLNASSKQYILTPYICENKYEGSVLILVNSYAMIASVLFLILTIVVYLLLKELRQTLSGKLMISYLISLTMGYIIISFINISGIQFDLILCSLLGFTCYFFLMAAFLWLNILCYDIWKNINETNNIEFNSEEDSRQFLCYSLYVWLIAGLATVVSVFVEQLTNLDDLYKPGIDKERCWLNTERWSAAIYFYGPTFVILLLNLVTFFRVAIKICKVRYDAAKLTNKEKLFRENVIVIYRLYLLMGISWIFDVLSYCFTSNRMEDNYQLYFAFTDFINAIQGCLIFVLFVLKRNILNLIRLKCLPTFSPTDCLVLQNLHNIQANVAI
ncbi:G-protein coupled receptor Mth2-like [Lucilia sericata]|uniref:G-protein coupled receptor Mth2-like n=1 Tax=Lucilia sericata TaxID=13632 RepID=UPI0018A874FC|nr:G-protein coupled receptor Mth2-like [Lucilia sericata]